MGTSERLGMVQLALRETLDEHEILAVTSSRASRRWMGARIHGRGGLGSREQGIA